MTTDTEPASRAGARRCARCAWRPDPDGPDRHEQALEHAAESGHPLCAVCTRSLADEEPMTCERCLTRARVDLASIVELYALLPEEIGIPATQVYDRSSRSSETLPLPGGDALVMLGPGGTGTTARRLTPKERLAGDPTSGPLVAGREHAADNRDDDGVSVAFALWTWERAWRDARREPVTLREQWWLPDAVGPLSPQQLAHLTERRLNAHQPTVMTAAGYLERRMRWAADHHDAFPDFVADLRAIRRRLEDANSAGERTVHAPVQCFDCGSKSLERAYRPAGSCSHERPRYEQFHRYVHVLSVASAIATPPPKWRLLLDFDDLIKDWDREHAGSCDQGGRFEHWVCSRCDREYEDAEYRLALAAQKSRDADARGWLSPAETATLLDLPVKQVRKWYDRRQLAAICSTTTRRMLVWWPAAHELAVKQAARRAELAEKRAERHAEQQSQNSA
jgi:hypothetical protein